MLIVVSNGETVDLNIVFRVDQPGWMYIPSGTIDVYGRVKDVYFGALVTVRVLMVPLLRCPCRSCQLSEVVRWLLAALPLT